MAKETYDICIIGAGASGIAAAIAAKNAQNDAKVILLEEKDKVGQKILATGNGRCNLSNRNIDPSHYGGDIERINTFSGLIQTTWISLNPLASYFMKILRAGSIRTVIRHLPF